MGEALVSLQLLVFWGEEIHTFDLPAEGDASIGRAESSQLRIDHPTVSRRHALLRRDGNTIRLEDLGAANGTFVRDLGQVETAGQTQIETLRRLVGESVEIAVGQSLQLGSVSAVLRRAPSDISSPQGDPGLPRGLVIADPAMRAVYRDAERAAATSIGVLILGETGVGKELLARSIHAGSPRAERAFLAFNCAAFSENLLEGELFGYERGAFTGAIQARPGLFEAAHGGTVFLDEVGEMPAPAQAKLLRVLEERAVLRIGARAARPIDVRFIAATNRDLDAEVRAARFREDLFYRLNGMTLTIPPLRERSADLDALITAFLETACRQLERAPIGISDAARGLLRAYAWPGNVRELKNAVERAVVLCGKPTIEPEHLPRAVTEPGAASAHAELRPDRFRAQMDALERARIVDALNRCDGNQTRAAELLGVSRRTLVSRLGALGLPRPRKRVPGAGP